MVIYTELPWGDKRTAKFVTNVGLITSDGPNGPNIMAAEWTHQASYSPGLIAVSIGHEKATAENIRATKRFGVGIASAKQAVLASVAGNYSGRQYDKIAASKALGFRFYRGRKAKVPMVKDTAMNAECRLVKAIRLGDHTMFVGEVLAASVSENKPVAYNGGRYMQLGRSARKPSNKEREKIKRIMEKHRKVAA